MHSGNTDYLISNLLHSVFQNLFRNVPVIGHHSSACGKIHICTDSIDSIQHHGHVHYTVIAVHTGNLQDLFPHHRSSQLLFFHLFGTEAITAGGTADTLNAFLLGFYDISNCQPQYKNQNQKCYKICHIRSSPF